MNQNISKILDYSKFSNNYKNILVTGGLGFIGSSLIERLLKKTNSKVYNIDKESYKEDPISTNTKLNSLGKNKYTFLNFDISNEKELKKTFKQCDPDLIFHLAAESHVDRSIESPRVFLNSNIIGTFNLLEESLKHYNYISDSRKKFFKFIHISTDEVYGSLGENGSFNENSPYSPRSPYSASKASSDHLVSSWFHTYGLPTLISNCSNNFGPRQFPDKLIPNIIISAIKKSPISIYGDGSNIRDWLFVEDHINALLLMALKGVKGKSYCIGAKNEVSNINLCKDICNILDKLRPQEFKYSNFIEYVDDRPGHDFRYSIDSSLINRELGWSSQYNFHDSINETVIWYLENTEWINYVFEESGYKRQRLGILK